MDTFLNIPEENEENLNYERKRVQIYPDLYKCVEKVNKAFDQKPNVLINLKTAYPIFEKVEPLQTTFSKIKNHFRNPESIKKFKMSVMSSLLEACCIECQNDKKELLFFASAALKLLELKEIISEIGINVNNIRISDSAIIFVLKYGNTEDENFFECIKLLLEAEVDINRSDVKGNFAIDYVAILYNKNTNPKVQETLKRIATLLLDKGICTTEEETTKTFIEKVLEVDLTKYKYKALDDVPTLFYLISKHKIPEFLAFKKIERYVNCDNGENTLLQFLVNKKNVSEVVEFLLENGADPNKTTELNTLTPLEIAARNSYENIFKILLDWDKTKISEDQFNNFVKWRGHVMKRKLFDLLLESDKLNPNFVYKKTNNTPLYYAIRLCHRNAIQKLLKRPDVSLTYQNKSGRCPLDVIRDTDLKMYFDSCLIPDRRRTIDFASSEYKIQFNFERMVSRTRSEVDLISRIGQYRHLEHLLAHPLIHTYIMLKWHRATSYFFLILTLQGFLFSLLSIYFFSFEKFSTFNRIPCFLFCLINIIVKCCFYITPKGRFKEIRSLSTRLTLYEYSELLLMITSIGSFFFKDFRAFIFIEMSVVFLLTAGFHPRLSHWSVMLQTVFKTFTKLLVAFSLLMIAFAVGFHTMFQNDRLFKKFFQSIFIMFFMTIGEPSLLDMEFDNTTFGGYLLYFVFGMSMSVVIINFWTALTIRDIDNFEKHSEVNALKNIISFLVFVEKNVYSVDSLKRILPDPMLFRKFGKKTYLVDFYVNKEDQFDYRRNRGNVETERRFPLKLDQICFDKIKLWYEQQNDKREEVDTDLQKFFDKLEANEKKIDQIFEILYHKIKE